MKREILSLTGLRGVAAFAVILYHYGQPSVDVAMPSRFHVPKGYLAVDCFFMLSGFVLSFNYAKLFLNSLRAGVYVDFAFRRFVRIYPAYAGISLIYIVRLLLNFSNERALSGYGWKDALGNLVVATGWGLGIKGVIGDAWSVSAELVCYALFPVVVGLLFRRGVLGLALLFLIAVLAYAEVATSGLGAKGWLDVIAPDSFVPLIRALAGFLLGMLLYQCFSATQPCSQALSDGATACGLLITLGSITFLDRDAATLVGVLRAHIRPHLRRPAGKMAVCKSCLNVPGADFLFALSDPRHVCQCSLPRGFEDRA